jgi:tetratricopeptide (TPR) repeat protein
LTSLAAPSRAQADAAVYGPEPAASDDPRALYEDGRKAYRLGDFAAAVKNWERAYAVSEKPLLLYNISLAYKGRYTITKDIADLRRAKAVLDNFIKLAQADPDLELDDAPERMAEIELLIVAAERDEAAGEGITTTRDPQPETQLRDMPEGKDPGRVFRLAGIGAMAGGGVSLLTGAGLVSFYILKSSEFGSNLTTEVDRLDEPGVAPCEDPRDADEPMGSGAECGQVRENISTWRSHGNAANRRAYISGGVLGGLALIGLVSGAVLFTEGNRRSRRWEQGMASRLRIAPTVRGFVMSGRF